MENCMESDGDWCVWVGCLECEPEEACYDKFTKEICRLMWAVDATENNTGEETSTKGP